MIFAVIAERLPVKIFKENFYKKILAFSLKLETKNMERWPRG